MLGTVNKKGTVTVRLHSKKTNDVPMFYITEYTHSAMFALASDLFSVNLSDCFKKIKHLKAKNGSVIMIQI